MSRRAFVFTLALLLGFGAAAAAQSPASGRWEGAITIMGQDLGIVVVLTADAPPKGTIDIPQQGAKDLPLANVRVEGQKVHFELAAGPGVAVFDGELKGEQLSGTFEQAGVKGTFALKKGNAPAQEPPPPYKQEEVKLENGGLTLAGTLTVPPGGGPHPALILITGSGAQNRDEDVFGFKVFKLLADHLTRAGFAVLRCDDRGVGGSTGSTMEATTSDFADDVLAQVKFLKTQPAIDKARIGLLGHSEGALVAPMVATRSPEIAFLVLLSGPAVTGEKIMLAQADLIGRAEGKTPEQVRANAEVQKILFTAARENKGWDDALLAVKAATRKAIAALPEEQRNGIPNVDVLVNRQAESQVAFARSPWFRFFLDYDPAPPLARVACPVLAVFGELDLQVPTQQNRSVMEDTVKKGGNRNWTFVVVPKANHLYQAATTGSATEYPKLKKEFAPGFLDTITSWLTKVTRPVPPPGAFQ